MVEVSVGHLRERTRKFLEITSPYFETDSSSGTSLGQIYSDHYGEDNKLLFLKHSTMLCCGFPFSYLNKMFGGEKLKRKLVNEFSPLNKVLNDEQFYLGEKLLLPYLKNFDKVLENGYSLYFYGNNARGKTFSALYAAYYLNRKSIESKSILTRTFFYVNFDTLIDIYLKSKLNNDQAYLTQLCSTILNCDLLIIDELGKEGKTHPHVISAAESIIKHRINICKPMIVIGNMKPVKETTTDHSSTIVETYGQSVYSAMTEKTRFIYFSSQSNPDMRASEKAWEF